MKVEKSKLIALGNALYSQKTKIVLDRNMSKIVIMINSIESETWNNLIEDIDAALTSVSSHGNFNITSPLCVGFFLLNPEILVSISMSRSISALGKEICIAAYYIAYAGAAAGSPMLGSPSIVPLIGKITLNRLRNYKVIKNDRHTYITRLS